MLAEHELITYTRTSKFSSWITYDDEVFQVVIDSTGAFFANRVFSTVPINTTTWVKLEEPTTQNNSVVKNMTGVLADTSKIWMARNKRVITFPARNFSEISSNLTAIGDVWFVLANKFLYSVIISSNGTFYPLMSKVIDTEVDPEKVTKVMATDSNIMIIEDKKLKMYQYQNQKFELKQTFEAFKDVEDIGISRIGANRLYKVKGSKNKFKVFSTLPSAEWNPYTEGIGKTPQLGDVDFSEVEFLEAGYGNLVIKANTGKQFKYFIASGTAGNMKYVEVYNSTKGSYTGAIETNSHLFLFNNQTELIVIHKQSNYKSMQGNIPDGTEVSTILSRSYMSEFSGRADFATNPNIMAVVSTGTAGSYKVISLGLGTIQVVCNPLTSLLGFLDPENQATMTFSILGVNSENSYLPEVRFSFNTFFIYNYGPIGSVFWIWVWIVTNITILLLAYRLMRLGLKRSRMALSINRLKLDEMEMKKSSTLTDPEEETVHIFDEEDSDRPVKRKSSGI